MDDVAQRAPTITIELSVRDDETGERASVDRVIWKHNFRYGQSPSEVQLRMLVDLLLERGEEAGLVEILRRNRREVFKRLGWEVPE